MAEGDPPIVITDGSIHIEFPEGIFVPEPGLAKGKFKNLDKKITRVVVTGGGLSFDETVKGKGVVIQIYYDNNSTS